MDEGVNMFLALCKDKPSLHELELEFLKLDQVKVPLIETHSAGIYIRQVNIPKGCLCIGARHREETCNIMLTGKMKIYIEEDDSILDVEGPTIFTSPKYSKKFGYCIEDTVFLTVHPTKETNSKKLDEMLLIPEEEYLALVNQNLKVVGG